jgi:hypothetical protein
MLSFKQKRRYKFLAILFGILQAFFILLFMGFMLSIMNNWFGFGDMALKNSIAVVVIMFVSLMFSVMSYILYVNYRGIRIAYLNTIKKYRTNRALHLLIHTILKRDYDAAVKIYDDLIPVDTEQRKVAYIALIFSLAYSKNPKHLKISEHEIVDVLNEYSFKKYFN